jgi:hypothetical protein
MPGVVKRVGAGQYATPDGRYLIEHEALERECECLSCQAGLACRNDGVALHWFWHVWDVERGDYAEGTDFSSFATLREAKAWLA